MSENIMVMESLDMLIKAVRNYYDELQMNKKILQDAANVCEAAMGSDDNVKKHIARLNDVLEKLERTAIIAENVAEGLMIEKQNALYTYED